MIFVCEFVLRISAELTVIGRVKKDKVVFTGIVKTQKIFEITV